VLWLGCVTDHHSSWHQKDILFSHSIYVCDVKTNCYLWYLCVHNPPAASFSYSSARDKDVVFSHNMYEVEHVRCVLGDSAASPIKTYCLTTIYMCCRCPGCISDHPSGRDKDTPAGGGSQGSDNVHRADGLCQEDLPWGGFPGLLEGCTRSGLCFLRATAATAVAHLGHRNSVRPSVHHTGGSVKNGAS